MSWEFLLTALIVVVSPGTGVLYTLATGLSRGAKASIVAAFGCTLGIVPHMTSAARAASRLASRLPGSTGAASTLMRAFPRSGPPQYDAVVRTVAALVPCAPARSFHSVPPASSFQIQAVPVVKLDTFLFQKASLENVPTIAR